MLSFSIAGSREYYNGELESNTYYAAFQRSFDDHGSYDSEEFVYFKTERSSLSSTGRIELAVVLSFLGLILLVAGYLVGKWLGVIQPLHLNAYSKFVKY